MTFRIHFETQGGHKDYVVVRADTLEEIREKAVAEVKARGGFNAWSEEINE